LADFGEFLGSIMPWGARLQPGRRTTQAYCSVLVPHVSGQNCTSDPQAASAASKSFFEP